MSYIINNNEIHSFFVNFTEAYYNDVFDKSISILLQYVLSVKMLQLPNVKQQSI